MIMKTSIFLIALHCLISTVYANDFTLAIGNSLQKIGRDGRDIDTLKFEPCLSISLARDESESFQVVIIPQAEKLEKVKIDINHDALPAGMTIKWYKIGYVKTGNPSYAVRHTGLWPDPLFTVKTFSVEKNQVQPIWFTVTTLPETKPGTYTVKLDISSGNSHRSVTIFIHVRNFVLPRPGTFSAPFGLYMKKIAEWYSGRGESLKIEDFYRWCEFVAKNYRITPKNIGYEYVTRKYRTSANGRKELESVDMSSLRQTVGRLAPQYFPDYSFGFYRLPSGSTVQKMLKKENHEQYLREILAPIKIYYDEWKKLNLPEKVYIYGIDEPPGADKAVFTFLHTLYSKIKEIMPDAKIMQTGNCDNPHLIGLVDIWCPKTERVYRPFFKNRIKDGNTLWAYVCVSPVPPYANFFIDEPAIDHRILFWQAKQAGASGFLYWSLAWWDGFTPACSGRKAYPDVTLDVRRHCQFQNGWVHVNGDGFLLYPGKNLTPIPSLRIEVIRDGIEDIEYMNLLRKLIDSVKKIPAYEKKGNQHIIAKAEGLLVIPQRIVSSPTQYTHNPDEIFAYRDEIANMIEQLSDILRNRDYKVWKN